MGGSGSSEPIDKPHTDGVPGLTISFHIQVRVFMKYNFGQDAVNNPRKIIFGDEFHGHPSKIQKWVT
jgi:hypothetical protein